MFDTKQKESSVTGGMKTVNRKAWLGLTFLAVSMGLLLFLAAGTIRYWQAWVYLAVYFVPSLIITIYLMKTDPALLKRRLRAGPTSEKERAQKLIMLIASIGFIASLVVPALDHRFDWSTVPTALEVVGDILIALCFLIAFAVYRENPYASATIELAPDQRLVSTGPYAIVRHPLYSGGMLLFAGGPLALGSFWGLIPFVAVMPVLIWRLLDEERFLSSRLSGYTDYCTKVRWRLIPRVF